MWWASRQRVCSLQTPRVACSSCSSCCVSLPPSVALSSSRLRSPSAAAFASVRALPARSRRVERVGRHVHRAHASPRRRLPRPHPRQLLKWVACDTFVGASGGCGKTDHRVRTFVCGRCTYVRVSARTSLRVKRSAVAQNVHSIYIHQCHASMLFHTHVPMHPHALIRACRPASHTRSHTHILPFPYSIHAHSHRCSLHFTPLHTLSHASHTLWLTLQSPNTHHPQPRAHCTSLHFTRCLGRSCTRHMLSHTHPTHTPARAHCTSLHFTRLEHVTCSLLSLSRSDTHVDTYMFTRQ